MVAAPKSKHLRANTTSVTKKQTRLQAVAASGTKPRVRADTKTRSLLKASRISQLESDNAVEDAEVDVGYADNEEEEQVTTITGTGSKKASKLLKKQARQRAMVPNTKRTTRKSFEQVMVELAATMPPPPNYLSAALAPSVYPARHFCGVCGFKAPHACVRCGTRFCSSKCLNVHSETRCLKFTR